MFHTDGKPFDEFQTITTRRLNSTRGLGSATSAFQRAVTGPH
jgi:hypothetical protein